MRIKVYNRKHGVIDDLRKSASFVLADILALANSIRDLSVVSRRMRTSMWSALQATIHYHVDSAVASGEKKLNDESALKSPSEELVEESQEAPDTAASESQDEKP